METLKEGRMPIHPNGSILAFRLRGKGRGVLQTIEIEGSRHTVRAEGHQAFGGTDSAPSPLDYVLSGLASCTQVTTFIVSRDLGVDIGEFSIDLRAELDNSVLVLGAEGNSNFSSVTLDIVLETDADAAAFSKLTNEIERRCPLTQLYIRSGLAITNNWTNRGLERSDSGSNRVGVPETERV
jgi:putative redox protein